MTMKTSKITTSRGTFNVRDRGNKDGLPVVMIHGWPESSYCWEGVTEFLNPNLRIIAPDLRGLGDVNWKKICHAVTIYTETRIR